MHRNRKSGFTLVEILIVVIILGILAAIVIPQFSNASQDARKSSLVSQLQTLRSQLELYKLQHRDEYPPGLGTTGSIASATAWAEMTVKTDEDHDDTVDADCVLGPYLQSATTNSLNSSSDVFVYNGADVTLGGASGATTEGWILNLANGKVWATAVNPAVVFNEGDLNDPDNIAPAP